MIELNGHIVSVSTLKDHSYIGDLLYFDGPLLSVFSDSNSIPYIYKWVDSDDNFNRWLIFRTSKNLLKEYLDGFIDQFNFIKESNFDFLYIADFSDELLIQNLLIVHFKDLPKEYLPSSDIYFEEEDSLDKENIFQYFSLNKVFSPTKNEIENEIFSFSDKYNSDIFNLHLLTGKGVKFGKVNTNLLSIVLNEFDDIYKGVVQDLFPKLYLLPPSKRPDDVKRQIEILESTVVIANKAASFSVYILPKYYEIPLFDLKSNSEMIAEKFFDIFNNLINLDNINPVLQSVSDRTLKKYSSFLGFIKENHVNLNINWSSIKTRYIITTNLNINNSYNVLNKIERLRSSNKIEMDLVGQFKALDYFEFRFKFLDNHNAKYIGKIGSDLREKILHIDKVYKIKIEREILKLSDTSAETYKDVLISASRISDFNF